MLKNVTGTKFRAIHRSMRRKGTTNVSLRQAARHAADTLSAAERAAAADGEYNGVLWLAQEAAAFMRRKGMRA